MRRGRFTSSQHGSTSSLALFTDAATASPSRPPLFEDIPDDSLPGTTHLLSDAALQRLIDRDGALNLVRQLARDLAERDSQITEIRKSSEETEKRLKNMLYDSGASRIEVERRLTHQLQRKASADSTLSGPPHSITDSLNSQLHTAMNEETKHTGAISKDTLEASVTPRPLRSLAGDDSNSLSELSVSRPRTSSSVTKWSAGIFGWGSARNPSNKGRQICVASPEQECERSSSRSREATEPGLGNSPGNTWTHHAMRNPVTREADIQSVAHRFADSMREKSWSDAGPPLHFQAIDLAADLASSDTSEASSRQRILSGNPHSTIVNMAHNLVSGRLQRKLIKHPTLAPLPGLESSDAGHVPASLHTRQHSLSIAKTLDSRSKAGLKDSAQAILPSVVPNKAATKDVPAMELATMIPDADQPPTMLPAWQSIAQSEGSSMLTDRYGFRLFEARNRRRSHERVVKPVNRQLVADSDVEFSIHVNNDTDSHVQDEDRSIHSTASSSDPKVASKDRNTHGGIIGIHGPASSPRPLSPETSLNNSDAIFSNENGSAKLHMLTQLDTYGADKVKQEQWDTFLRKTREDRRRPEKDHDELMDQNEDELIGIATMGTGKMAKERRKELVALVLAGVPIAYRPKIWGEMTGAYRMKEPGYYEELLNHRADIDSVSIDQIELDLKRTMPSNVFFAGIGSGVPKLRRVLLAFSRHNTEVGYCQGMNVIAATLLLTHPTEEDAFFVLACIVENILPARYFTPDLLMSRVDQTVLKKLVRALFVKVDDTMQALGVDLEAITFGWFLSIFTDCLPAEFLFRTWDILFMEGHSYLFCTALAIIKLHERVILQSHSPAEIYTLLRELNGTKDTSIDEFVRLMEQIRITMRQKGFDIAKMHTEVLAEMQRGNEESILNP